MITVTVGSADGVLAHAPRPRARGELGRRRIGDVRPRERPQRAPEQSLQQHRSSVRPLEEAGTVSARARSRRTDPRAARDRPPQRGRAVTPRLVSHRGTRVARLRDDARGRRDLRGRGVDGVRRRAARHRGAVDPASSSARSRRSHDAGAVRRLAELIRQERPHVLHTHTAKAGTVGRARGTARRLRAPAGRRPHLPRPHARGLLRPGEAEGLPADRAHARARDRCAHRRQPRGARRARRDRRRAGVALRGRAARHRALRAHGGRRAGRRAARLARHRRRSGSRSAGSAG